jgi:ABC-type nitrate/sulfonate/bicarbonate transport system permease component
MFIPRRILTGRYADAVSEPLRISLRLLGLVLLIVSLCCLVALVWPGPREVAEAMGTSCTNDRLGSNYQCTWWDAADVLVTAFGVSLVAGFVLRLLTRPAGKGPRTLDLSWLRRR